MLPIGDSFKVQMRFARLIDCMSTGLSAIHKLTGTSLPVRKRNITLGRVARIMFLKLDSENRSVVRCSAKNWVPCK